VRGRTARHRDRLDHLRNGQRADRVERSERFALERTRREQPQRKGISIVLAERLHSATLVMDRFLESLLGRDPPVSEPTRSGVQGQAREPAAEQPQQHGGDRDR
jgi:hypothetical protein